ncbi:MAG: tetratricopeptide repeat protein, partial [Gammaproteobacteria bacterium]|nr:tetratricopeptide repeat protein [Gammaproteobacteria bacterium]
SARIYQLKGDTAAAIESAQRSLDAFASSVHSIETAAHQVLIRNMLGQLHMDNGDLEAAEQVLEEVLRIFPGHPTTNVLLAEIAIRRNNFTRAENHLDVSLGAWQNAPASYTEARRARALVNRLESG